MLEVDRLSIRFKLSWEKTRTLSDSLARRVKAILGGHRTQYFEALKEITFEARQGDIVGVIGPNGSGKSTLLRAISGIYQPDRGNVRCYGKVSSLLSLGTGFDLALNGIDNIYLNGMLTGMAPKKIDSQLDEIIEFAELRDEHHSGLHGSSNDSEDDSVDTYHSFVDGPAGIGNDDGGCLSSESDNDDDDDNDCD